MSEMSLASFVSVILFLQYDAVYMFDKGHKNHHETILFVYYELNKIMY